MTTEHDLATKFALWCELPPRIADEMAAWRFVPYLVDSEPVALAAIYGSEIHFAIDPAWRGRLIQRQRTRDFLEPMFDRYGFLTTTAYGEAPTEQERFLDQLGFEPTWDEPDRRHFMMTRLPFSKEN